METRDAAMEDRVWCSKRASHVHSEPLYRRKILHETIVCFYLNVFPKFKDIFFCLIYFVKENIMLHGYLIVLHQLSTCNWILEVLLFPCIFTGLTPTTHSSVIMSELGRLLLPCCWFTVEKLHFWLLPTEGESSQGMPNWRTILCFPYAF